MAISMDPIGTKLRAQRRNWLRAGGYWADLCRTKNGKAVYRWISVHRRSRRAMSTSALVGVEV